MGKESLEKEQAKNLESKEEEKVKDSFIVYRENRLFKEWVPVIEKILSSLGSRVNIKSFPAETKPEEIGNWITANTDKIMNSKFIPDYTSIKNIEEICASGMSSKGIRKLSKIYEKCISLDRIFSNATILEIFGKMSHEIPWEGEEDIEVVGKNYVSLFKKILENKRNMPKKVYIVLESLLDHSPFGGAFRRQNKESDEIVSRKAGEKVKEWLVKGGIPAKNIVLSSDIIRTDDGLVHGVFSVVKEIKKFNHTDNWIISDRHIVSSDIFYVDDEMQFKNSKGELNFHAKHLELPLFNFWEDVQEQGLVKPNPEKMEEALTEVLKEEFAPKEEK